VSRKAQIEEDRRNRRLQIEREERERQLEQARIDRLLNEAASLRQAMDIRAYVDAVKSIVMRDTTSISAEETEWALEQADRIDPVRSARFLDTFDEGDDTE
jgi:predicted RNase H-like nuclease (RuvC/YqgF family)